MAILAGRSDHFIVFDLFEGTKYRNFSQGLYLSVACEDSAERRFFAVAQPNREILYTISVQNSRSILNCGPGNCPVTDCWLV